MVKYSQSELEKLEQALCAGEDVEAPDSQGTRLHQAAHGGDLARMKLLLRFGANVDARDEDGRHPMHTAVAGNECIDEETRAEAVKLLLAAGADPHARDADGDTPLSLAYICDHPYCVHALIEAADGGIFGLWRTRIPTFVIDLIRNPDGAKVVARELALGVDVNTKDDRDYTLLDRAAFCGSPSAVRALLNAGAKANAKTRCSPLCSTAVLMKNNGGEEAVVTLIRAGADVNALSFYNPPLHRAAEYHSLAAVRLLLDSGADPNLLSAGRSGQSPLRVAVEYARDDDDCDIIKALLQGGADVNGLAQDRPLHAASERGHASTVRLLLEAGADPHLRDWEGLTALHRAVRRRDCTVLATASALLDAGADSNAQDSDRQTPLHHALWFHPPPELIELLLKAGADPRIRGWQGHTLHVALMRSVCTATVLSALLDAGADPCARDDNGETPLHHAVKHYAPSVTLLLLKAGADPHARDIHGRTPLFHAMFSTEGKTHWLDHVAMLRDAGPGANIDDQDAKWITSQYHALLCVCARWETICSLLRLGADPYAGCTGDLMLPRAIVGLIGNSANMEATLGFVTRVRIQSEDVRSAQDQCISSWDLSDSEKEGCRVLARIVREQMLEQPASERKESIALLSTLYTVLDYYPSDATLHECEVALSQSRPSSFGGFADCWQGSFLGQHTVAMKTFRGYLAEEVGARRLAREAKIWSQLNHPNVLPFLGLCTLGSVPYLVSPWMENGHVLDYVQKNSDVDRVRLLAQVARGLEYLHNLKPEPVIHGDLRGPNILISPSGDACIADFGLSELKTDIYDNYSTSFVTAGNSRWRTPEILRATTKEEARRNTTTDTFAFGRVMLEFFTGKTPFFYLEYDAMVTMKVLSTDPFPRRPDEQEITARGLDDAMWQLMMNCWDVTPSKRPNATNLVARLTAALESRSAGESPSSVELPIGSVEPSTTLSASTDVSTEDLTAQNPTRLGETESPPSGGELSPTPTKHHTHQVQLYLALGFCVFGLVAIRLKRYLL